MRNHKKKGKKEWPLGFKDLIMVSAIIRVYPSAGRVEELKSPSTFSDLSAYSVYGDNVAAECKISLHM